MLEFTTADEASMDAFLAVSAASMYQQELEDYAASLLRQEATKPDWCVLGLAGGKPVARVALWAPPGQSVPTDTVLIECDWNDEDLSAGQAVLSKAHELAADLGADTLAHSVDSPPASPQYQENEDARIRLLTGAGYGLLRDGLRWRYSGSSPEEGPQEPSLVFRPLPEVGEGLAPRLVRRGTEQLLESGATEIRGDCDLDNVAMVKAFERAGYEQFARRRTYRREIAA
jgi:hypothetical protein